MDVGDRVEVTVIRTRSFGGERRNRGLLPDIAIPPISIRHLRERGGRLEKPGAKGVEDENIRSAEGDRIPVERGGGVVVDSEVAQSLWCPCAF